jgi:glycosidase
MASVLYPSLYQINTRVWLTELSQKLGRVATLDDIPDAELDRIAALGFDWVWLLSVWQTGLASQKVSRTNAEWRKEFQNTLPDLHEDDIPGSGFAITGYMVHDQLGGDAALARVRQRLEKRNLRLMLDFVPNHTGLDHPWVEEHPEYYVAGTELDLARAPTNYTRIKTKSGTLLPAHGRDPFFPGWPDALQLNYGNPATQEAMLRELLRICSQCDGVRCDMAMLVLPDVFERTWGIRAEPFWAKAIERVRAKVSSFRFMAEVYWDLEWTMQQQGFDYTYDKRLYDRLRDKHARAVREHFYAGMDYQNKLTRFLENHDEPRAAATFAADVHQAAALLTFLSPGMRFFHQGQFQGCKKRISPHLGRAPKEPVNQELDSFYDRLLGLLRLPIVREGQWRLNECAPAWEGNGTWDNFVSFSWSGSPEEWVVVAVNYASHQGQCYVKLPLANLEGSQWRLRDQLSSASYDRNGADLHHRGLYLDMPAWGYHVFKAERL